MREAHATMFAGTMLALCLGLLIAGCDQGTTGQSDAAKHTRISLPDGLMLDRAPTGVTAISQLKESAKEGDEVVLRAVVGGRVKPIVDNRAVMTVVDASTFNQCTNDDDMCESPWDYCCASAEQLKPHLATVQVVDDHGRPLGIDLKSTSRIKPLSVLVVKGNIAPRSDASTLIVNVTGLFVETIQ